MNDQLLVCHTTQLIGLTLLLSVNYAVVTCGRCLFQWTRKSVQLTGTRTKSLLTAAFTTTSDRQYYNTLLHFSCRTTHTDRAGQIANTRCCKMFFQYISGMDPFGPLLSTYMHVNDRERSKKFRQPKGPQIFWLQEGGGKFEVMQVLTSGVSPFNLLSVTGN